MGARREEQGPDDARAPAVAQNPPRLSPTLEAGPHTAQPKMVTMMREVACWELPERSSSTMRQKLGTAR